eukprot:GFUD01028199.1.p1 GENE.GFUD01028199.1~~GFUD01028199.1.p1  ORF type:complete len:272 (-),score=61.56 GFUD01028199.1:69-884(-)
MIKLGVFIFFLLLSFATSQLIGSRGVIRLKEGVEYRDAETRDSSKAVAIFAKRFQHTLDDIAKKNKKQMKTFRSSVSFSSANKYKNTIGREIDNSDIFGFQSSRLLQPLEELRFNKLLEEIENERTTSSLRLLPSKQSITTPSPVEDKIAKLSINLFKHREATSENTNGKMNQLMQKLSQPIKLPSITKTQPGPTNPTGHISWPYTVITPWSSSSGYKPTGSSYFAFEQDLPSSLAYEPSGSSSLAYGPAFSGGVFTHPGLFYSLVVSHAG